MNPKQRKQLAQILLKEGEDGWRVDAAQILRNGNYCPWEPMKDDHYIYAIGWRYRAIRIERTPKRTPLPIEHYRRGMEIHFADAERLLIRGGAKGENTLGQTIAKLVFDGGGYIPVGCVKRWRWANETEWHPAYTETVEEKIVETLIVEGL